MDKQRIHLFGIRHHGPGSARSLRRALADLRPDCLLIEGPPDADPLLGLAASEELRPPVALLVYDPNEPSRAAFYPFAEFSPEWQAIRYGVTEGAPTRFMDLPQALRLAPEPDPIEGVESEALSDMASDDPVRVDPLGRLAVAAGYPDGERWWDAVVESRRDGGGGVFSAVAEAMTVVRDGCAVETSQLDRRREAYMRQTLRATLKEGFERIAVVCGAWHVPALDPKRWPSTKEDTAELKGLRRTKTQAAWTPWTYGRLAADSGYGAGVVSPAWYELLWKSPDADVAARWMTRVARLMREHDLDASSAHVIEAVRLGEALAAMRGRTLAGLEDLDEAALSVLCTGQEAPMRLVRRKLVVGERLGSVPEGAPMVPLQRDLASLQKSLRFPPKAEFQRHDFDLRKPIDLERSRLLHRLKLLDVPWGEVAGEVNRSRGTFHEHWRVQWAPEFAVRLIAATRYGGTVAEAASAKTIEASDQAKDLDDLTALLGDALLAGLPQAVESLIASVRDRASTGADVRQLMAAAPALGRVARYGDVRQTDAALMAEVFRGVVERVCVGLPPACVSIDTDAAAQLLDLVDGVNASLAVANETDLTEDWYDCLAKIAEREDAHPTLAGHASRLWHDAGRAAEGETARRLGLALSPGVDRGGAAAWLEGFLRGSGLLLIHDNSLWGLVDAWVIGLDASAFTEALPLLRRTFSSFSTGERRQMSERVQVGDSPLESFAVSDFNHDRAARALPLVAQLLGLERPQ